MKLCTESRTTKIVAERLADQRQQGFTLIEVMIVVAIIGILAAVAVPAYRDYVIRGKLAEASATLSQMRVQLEQYYQDNRTYIGACAAGTNVPIPTGRYFAYDCPTLTAIAFTATATGVAAEGMTGFTYTINEKNERKSTALPDGWGTATVNCWVTKKGGQC